MAPPPPFSGAMVAIDGAMPLLMVLVVAMGGAVWRGWAVLAGWQMSRHVRHWAKGVCVLTLRCSVFNRAVAQNFSSPSSKRDKIHVGRTSADNSIFRSF